MGWLVTTMFDAESWVVDCDVQVLSRDGKGSNKLQYSKTYADWKLSIKTINKLTKEKNDKLW